MKPKIESFIHEVYFRILFLKLRFTSTREAQKLNLFHKVSSKNKYEFKFFYEAKVFLWNQDLNPYYGTYVRIYIYSFFHGTKVLMPSVTVYTIQEYFTALNSTEVYLDGCQYATCSRQVLKSAWLCKVMRVLTSSHHLFTLFHSICLILDLMKSQSRNTRFNCYVCLNIFKRVYEHTSHDRKVERPGLTRAGSNVGETRLPSVHRKRWLDGDSCLSFLWVAWEVKEEPFLELGR